MRCVVVVERSYCAGLAGSAYDAELGLRQARAIARYMGQRYVLAGTAALWVSLAREHELMAVIDFVAGIPIQRVSHASPAVAKFAGGRASIVLGDHDEIIGKDFDVQIMPLGNHHGPRPPAPESR